MIEAIERAAFQYSLHHPRFFEKFVRKELYRRHKDPEKVHEEALKMLNKYQDVLENYRGWIDFNFPDLTVEIKGRTMKPFGTAAGFDKNGDALIPLSKIFGFLEPGTVVVNPREGNQRPRIATDTQNRDMYNAQGFPSEGLDYFHDRVREYRATGAETPLYISVCGLPPADVDSDKGLWIAWDEMRQLLEKLAPYADGFVWNPFSPNTSTLEALRRPSVFREYAELVSKYSGEKLKLVKMGPYEDNDSDRYKWLDLINAWLEGGGDGIVAVNTKMVSKEEVPSKQWGYKSAGRSGAFLREYRMRAVADARKTFPGSIIFATGGIGDGRDAYETFDAGANAIEGYTPYTYNGLGLLKRLMEGVSNGLWMNAYSDLKKLTSDK